MNITYYGQSCFLLETAGKKLLFDPFITPNELAKDIDVNSIQADYILVSHGHEDHTADLVDIAKGTGALVISSFEIMVWLNKQGVTNCHPMNIGGQRKFDFGSVKMRLSRLGLEAEVASSWCLCCNNPVRISDDFSVYQIQHLNQFVQRIPM